MAGSAEGNGPRASSTTAARAVELLVCQTCASRDRETHGHSGGERLQAHLERLLREASHPGIVVRGLRCLWACQRSCNVQVRSADAPGYVLTELEPSEASARALLDWALLYSRSAEGAVPFREWPQGVRGHFLCRVPPPSPALEETP